MLKTIYFASQSTFNMSSQQDPIEVLRDIRSWMERSGRFLSVSGLAGVYVGVYALICFFGLHAWLGVSPFGSGLSGQLSVPGGPDDAVLYRWLGTGMSLLVVSLATGLRMAARKAVLRGEPLWDATSRRLLLNAMTPMVVGGLYIVALLHHGYYLMVLPATLIFYGMGLFLASRDTLREIRGLGMAFLLTGLAATWQPLQSHWYWIFGFGVLHIIYGLWMYWKYER